MVKVCVKSQREVGITMIFFYHSFVNKIVNLPHEYHDIYLSICI